jgi:hypothetical protein
MESRYQRFRDNSIKLLVLKKRDDEERRCQNHSKLLDVIYGRPSITNYSSVSFCSNIGHKNVAQSS